MRAGLICHDIDRNFSPSKLRKHFRGVSHKTNRIGARFIFRQKCHFDGLVDVRCHKVEVPMFDPSLQPRLIDVDDDNNSLVEGDREGLSPSHSSTSSGEGEGSGQCPAKMLASHSPESFIRSLKNPLGANVNPRSRRHLAVHGQSECLESAKFWPGSPIPHEVRVRDQDSGRPLMGAEYSHGLARLD